MKHKIKNKGFTLIETISVIIILAIVLGIVSIAFIFVNDRIKRAYYSGVEESLFTAGGEYYAYNKGIAPKLFGVETKVNAEKLIDEEYISEVVGRGNNTCNLEESYVLIKYQCNTKDYTYTLESNSLKWD